MKRIFSIGTMTSISDPCPLDTLQEAFELLVLRFPHVRHSAVFESDATIVDAKTVKYTIPLVPSKTNG